jgi:hypothetical protein
MRFVGLIAAILFSCAPPLTASPCATDLLSNYILLTSTGCQVGPLTVKDFTFNLIAATVVINASDITVTPVFALNRFGLDFSSNSFAVSGSNFAHYLLAYTWDPGDIRSLEDVLGDPVTAPGLGKITTDICEDAAFVGAFCPTTAATTSVFDDGIAPVLFSSVAFSPFIGVAGIRDTIQLDGNNHGSVKLFDFTNQLVVAPEPATFAEGLLALALCGGSLRLKRH